MWPVDVKKNTLAVIGLIQPTGAINPISEIQCRWATRVIKGLQDLPHKSVMRADIAKVAAKQRDRYYKSERHTIQVEYIPYMDTIANKIGAVPDLKKLFKKDVFLGWKVLMGPATPYQFRLNGPGSDYKKARRHINEQMNNVLYPLVSTHVMQQTGFGISYLVAVFCAVLLLCTMLFG